MSDFKQHIFKSHVADELRSEVKKLIGLERYFQENAQYKDSELWPLRIELGSDLPGLGRERHLDGENAVNLHKYLINLDVTQASDKRLWTYLAHKPFRDYVQKRWPLPYSVEEIELSLGAKKSVSSSILLHWFVNANDSRALKRHALARLWWAAHLTYAPWKIGDEFKKLEQDDEYVYTKFYTEVAERVLGSSRHILIAFLEYFMQNPEALNRKNLRPIVKEVNMISGVKKLSTLNYDEIYEIISSIADEIVVSTTE